MRSGHAPADSAGSRRYFVRGRVQGVGFRWFVQSSAESLGISGWTRNLADGQVEVYATGSPEQLNELGALLWKGPSLSDVRGVDEEEADWQQLAGFRILD